MVLSVVLDEVHCTVGVIKSQGMGVVLAPSCSLWWLCEAFCLVVLGKSGQCVLTDTV